VDLGELLILGLLLEWSLGELLLSKEEFNVKEVLGEFNGDPLNESFEAELLNKLLKRESFESFGDSFGEISFLSEPGEFLE